MEGWKRRWDYMDVRKESRDCTEEKTVRREGLHGGKEGMDGKRVWTEGLFTSMRKERMYFKYKFKFNRS